jgi:hypothetical protein
VVAPEPLVEANPAQAQEVQSEEVQAEEVQPQDVQPQEVQPQEVAPQEVAPQPVQAQDEPGQVVAFAPGIELPPATAPSGGQPREVSGLGRAAARPAEDTRVTIPLPEDDTLAQDPSPISIDPAKIANLQSVLDALDRARTRTPDPPAVAGPRPLVGPGGVIDTAVSRVASAVAGPATSPSSRRPASVATPGASAAKAGSAVPPALQVLRLRIGQPEGSDKPPAETTALRVRVAPDTKPRLMALEANHSVSTDVLSLGLFAAAVAGIGLFGRAANKGRRRFRFWPRRR